MSKVLELKFLNGEGKVRTLTIQNPIDNLTPSQVQAAMTAIINQDLFYKDGVAHYTALHSARYVDRQVQDIFVIEDQA